MSIHDFIIIAITFTARADLSVRPGLPHTSTAHPVQYQTYIHTHSITACKEEVSNPPAKPTREITIYSGHWFMVTGWPNCCPSGRGVDRVAFVALLSPYTSCIYRHYYILRTDMQFLCRCSVSDTSCVLPWRRLSKAFLIQDIHLVPSTSKVKVEPSLLCSLP